MPTNQEIYDSELQEINVLIKNARSEEDTNKITNKLAKSRLLNPTDFYKLAAEVSDRLGAEAYKRYDLNGMPDSIILKSAREIVDKARVKRIEILEKPTKPSLSRTPTAAEPGVVQGVKTAEPKERKTNEQLYQDKIKKITDLINKPSEVGSEKSIEHFKAIMDIALAKDTDLPFQDRKKLAKEVNKLLSKKAEEVYTTNYSDHRSYNNAYLEILEGVKKEEKEIKQQERQERIAKQQETYKKGNIFGSTGFIKHKILNPIDNLAGDALDFARQPQQALFDMVKASWKEKGVTGKLKAVVLAVPATVCFVAVEGVSTAIKEATNCIRKPLAFVYNASATMKNTAAVAGNLINCMVRGFSKENKEELSKATNLLKLTAKDAGKDLFNSAKAVAITALTVSPFAPLVPLAAGAVAGVATIAPMLASVGAPHIVTAGINSGAHAVSQAISQAAVVVPSIPSVSLGKIAVSSSPVLQGLTSATNTVVNGASAGAQAAVNGLISASNSAVKFAPASASVVKAIATKTGAKQNSAAR